MPYMLYCCCVVSCQASACPCPPPRRRRPLRSRPVPTSPPRASPGGFFHRRPDGTYDTIISAQHIFKSVADSHQAAAGLRVKPRCVLPSRQRPWRELGRAAVAAAGRGAEGKREPEKDAGDVAAEGRPVLAYLVKAGGSGHRLYNVSDRVRVRTQPMTVLLVPWGSAQCG